MWWLLSVRHFEKAVMLQTLDAQWKEHLAQMDYLRQGINLRGYARKDPKQEFKREAFQLFTHMLDTIKRNVISYISQVKINDSEDVVAIGDPSQQNVKIKYQHEQKNNLINEGKEQTQLDAIQPYIRDGRKIGRNEPCPCGSGKKFKQCHRGSLF